MKASHYILTSNENFSGTGQANLVWKILKNHGSLTVNEIAAHLSAMPEFHTRQTAQRIAAYYVCVFKKAGICGIDVNASKPFNPFSEVIDEKGELK